MKFAAFFSLSFVLAACAAGEPVAEMNKPELPAQAASYVTGMVRVAEVPADPATGVVVLDLRDTKNGFWFEPGLDLSNIDVVCPSGRVMNMEAWVVALSTAPGAGIAEEKDFVVFSSTKNPPSSDLAPICDGPGCYAERETNGTWSCICSGM